MTEKKEILLSIITYGRNDNYLGNFPHRLKLNLSKLVDNISKLGANDIEIVVSDWGSDIKLSDYLEINQNDFLNWVYIPKEVCRKYTDSPFSTSHAANAAFRRSKGKFILVIDADGYIPFDSFKKMYELLLTSDDNAFYWASRWHISEKLHESCDGIKNLDTEIEKWEASGRTCWPPIEVDHGVFPILSKISLSQFGGGAIGTLLSRKICEESTFFYEELTRWGFVDVEMHNRYTRQYKCMGDLYDLGMTFFHLCHKGIGGDVNGYNQANVAPKFKANEDGWGLINEQDVIIYKN
jgi:glycosyltransferase involved in cell wall biosynthesis